MREYSLAKTDTVPTLEADLAQGGTTNVSLTDEHGQTVAINFHLKHLVKFCRDVLTRVREAGTDVPE